MLGFWIHKLLHVFWDRRGAAWISSPAALRDSGVQPEIKYVVASNSTPGQGTNPCAFFGYLRRHQLPTRSLSAQPSMRDFAESYVH